MPLREEPPAKMRAEKTGAARDQNFLSLWIKA